MKQYLQICRMSGLSEEEVESAFNNMLKNLPGMTRSKTPPEIAAYFSGLIAEESGVRDPYSSIKKASNDAAMSIYDELKKRVNNSVDPFTEALSLAIAGNLIDFGVKVSLDLKASIDEIIGQPLFQNIESGEYFNDDLFQLKDFYTELRNAEDIIYLGDNAGEIVFDRLFIETLLSEHPGKKITYIVRGGPALNDVLQEDAEYVGLDKIVDVMSSGTATAGTVLSNCSPEFLDKLYKAELVISKGQGNFEALSGENLPPTWFLFRIKCRAVAGTAGGPEGTLVLKKNLVKALIQG